MRGTSRLLVGLTLTGVVAGGGTVHTASGVHLSGAVSNPLFLRTGRYAVTGAHLAAVELQRVSPGSSMIQKMVLTFIPATPSLEGKTVTVTVAPETVFTCDLVTGQSQSTCDFGSGYLSYLGNFTITVS